MEPNENVVESRDGADTSEAVHAITNPAPTPPRRSRRNSAEPNYAKENKALKKEVEELKQYIAEQELEFRNRAIEMHKVYTAKVEDQANTIKKLMANDEMYRGCINIIENAVCVMRRN